MEHYTVLLINLVFVPGPGLTPLMAVVLVCSYKYWSHDVDTAEPSIVYLWSSELFTSLRRAAEDKPSEQRKTNDQEMDKKHGWVPYFIIIHTWVYVIFFTLHYMDMVGNKNWWRTLFFLLCWQRQGINTRPHTINITYEEFCPSDVSRNSVHYIPSIFDEPWSYERV